MSYFKGQIYYADLGEAVGSEQGGIRPVVIIQNNLGNYYAPTLIVAPITSKKKHNLPTHVEVNKKKAHGLILLEQIVTIDKERILDEAPVDSLNYKEIEKVNEAIKVSLGL